jgi:uncharacterized membrane protein YcjF (UPF0283 family)
MEGSTMATADLHLGRHLWGLGASLITLVAGAWLMLAPFALGYQPYGADWISQTHNDFWVGLGVIIVSAIGVGLFVASLRSELRAAGVMRLQRRAPASFTASGTTPAGQFGTAAASAPGVPLASAAPQQSDFERAMAALATALAADMAERRKAENGPVQTLQSVREREQ